MSSFSVCKIRSLPELYRVGFILNPVYSKSISVTDVFSMSLAMITAFSPECKKTNVDVALSFAASLISKV